jgi:hypothetical protein
MILLKNQVSEKLRREEFPLWRERKATMLRGKKLVLDRFDAGKSKAQEDKVTVVC